MNITEKELQLKELLYVKKGIILEDNTRGTNRVRQIHKRS